MRRIGENKYYSFFFDIFLFRVKLHFCSYHSFCPTIYIYIHTHVYGRYIKKGMESKLNPITSVSSVDTACSGEFIFNGIRGDGKCRGLPSNEICPTEREKEREGRGFVSEKVSLRGSRIFQRLGEGSLFSSKI